MAATQNRYTFDKDLELKDAGAVTAAGHAQVGGANKTLDLKGGKADGVMVVNVSAIDVASGDEKYELELQGSNDNFSTVGEILAMRKLGHSSVNGKTASDGTGQHVVPFTNEGKDGTVYRYLRMYHRIAGSTPSINYTAFLAQNP